MAVYSELANSTYLDLTSYRGNAALPDSNLLLSSFTVNVALVLDRANGNDPTALLSSPWATRQAALADQTAIFQQYGADPADYNTVLTALGSGPGGLGIPTVDQVGAKGYVSSVESRTIWVQLNDANFTTLFGSNAALFLAPQPDAFGNPIIFWKGNLSLPDTLINAGVSGLWFDWDALSIPILADQPKANGVALAQGPQSVGNSGPVFGEYPNAIAAAYNFPLSSAALWTSVPTGAVGLIEPGIGTEPNPGRAFQELLNAYRQAAGIAAPAPMTIDVAPGGQQFINSPERSLDVGIVTTVNPQSPIVIYAGSGVNNGAHFDAFTAYQAAFWDTANNPEVISSSTKSFSRVAPGSPFYSAIQELFVDAALRNITVVSFAGGTALNGPGYGNFGQAGLLNVDGGDLIAMQLVNNTTGAQYWAFASANEKVGGQSVGHLWNYGLNSWGWEDTFGGGDRDFNDLVVQLDFTSASGHGWLV